MKDKSLSGGSSSDCKKSRLKKLKATRRQEGQNLLRSNLTGEDPNILWRNYINPVRIKENFRSLKDEPIHQSRLSEQSKDQAHTPYLTNINLRITS